MTLIHKNSSILHVYQKHSLTRNHLHSKQFFRVFDEYLVCSHLETVSFDQCLELSVRVNRVQLAVKQPQTIQWSRCSHQIEKQCVQGVIQLICIFLKKNLLVSKQCPSKICLKIWFNPYILDPPNPQGNGLLFAEPMNLTQEPIINSIFHHHL